MSSELKANKISPATGTAMTLGDSGDTFTVPSGSTLDVNGTIDLTGATQTGVGGDNTPAFFAERLGDMSISDATVTKIEFNTEIFDTDSAYDNSTNYRFTVPSGEGGKYFVYAQAVFYSSHGGNDLKVQQLLIKKNGSNMGVSESNRNDMGIMETLNITCTLDLAAADYLEVYAYFDNQHGSSYTKIAGDAYPRTHFGAYKLIGV
tara:strand:- start:3057 stop:3671 length:615 start_codon:yes stop_codon:yes gene_type:complete